VAPRAVPAAAFVVAVLVAGAVAVRSPYRDPPSEPLTDAIGMGVYGDDGMRTPHALPPPADADGTARSGDVTVRVTGPVTTSPPPGAPGWVRDVHLIVVPVLATAPPPARADLSPGYVALELVGRGRGRAVRLDAPACGGAPGAFDGRLTATRVQGPVCFVVPKDFRPLYLIVGSAGQDRAVPLAT